MKVDPRSWTAVEKTFLGIEKTKNIPSGDLQKEANEGIIKIARATNSPLLLTQDSHFVRPEQKFIQDILLKQGSNGWHFHSTYAQFSLEESWQKWKRLHGDLPDMARIFAEAVENNSALVSRVENVSFQKEYHLPPVELPYEIETMDVCKEEKFKEHVYSLIARHGRFPESTNPKFREYVDRLNLEISVIADNGVINFLPYFF